MEPSKAGTPLAEAVLVEGNRHLQVTVESGDALATFGDVLLLKYAEASHGLDRIVAKGLEQHGSSVADLLPLPGRSLMVAAGSVAGRPNTSCSWEHRPWADSGTTRCGRGLVKDWWRRQRRPDKRRRSSRQSTGPRSALRAHSTRTPPSRSEVRGFRRAALWRSGQPSNDRPNRRTRRGTGETVGRWPRARRSTHSDDWELTAGALSRTVLSAHDHSPRWADHCHPLAAAYRRGHPKYARTTFGRVQLDPEVGPKNTVDVWLTQMPALYDTTELSASQSVLLSGRLVVAGLAMIDRQLRTVLTRDEVLAALLAEMDILPWDPSLRQQVPWTPDKPVGRGLDELGRRLIAKALAGQLAGFDRDHRGDSFALLVDGRWGAGKTTLLEFLVDEANNARGRAGLSPVCVVPFDAWRQSWAGPPWLRLMTALRSQLVGQHHLRGWTRVREWLRRLGTATVVTAVVVAVAATTLAVLWQPQLSILTPRRLG